MEFQNQLHFLLVPFMSQSHVIPFTEMAKLLAHHGLTVTIVMTPLNASRYNKVIEYAESFNLHIQFLSLPFPCQEAGLPEGCENRDLVPSLDLVPNFFKASNMLQEPLRKWVRGLKSQLNCIISDICFPWTADISLEFKIPRIVLHGISCFTLLCSHNIGEYKVVDSVTSDFETFIVPEILDRIEFTRAQLPELRNPARLNQFKEAELSADGVAVNSFEELEPAYAKGYQKVVKNLWCLGPLSLYNKGLNYEHESIRWLDSRKQRSVLYVCFGSLGQLSSQQLVELALGLEASDCPFIWVVRGGDYSSEFDKWLTEERFKERTEGRGIIFRAWVPQVQILSHPAISGFLTHCGWNSTLEGISSGLPLITWPMFAEQFHNEKLIVNVLKIGVRIGVEIPVFSGEEVLVKKEEIEKAINQLMDEGEEGEDRRRRSKELGKMAKRAVEEGGSSYQNLKSLIQHVIKQVNHHNQSNYSA